MLPKEPDSHGENQTGRLGDTFKNAAIYGQLNNSADRINPEAPRNPHNRNSSALEGMSIGALPQSAEPSDPNAVRDQRMNVLKSFGDYAPNLSSEAENAKVYNIVRRTMETTPPFGVTDGGLRSYDTLATRALAELAETTFGPEGPEFTTTNERLHNEEAVYTWSGQPIELTLGLEPEHQSTTQPDFRLAQYSYTKAGQAVNTWRLRSSADEYIDLSQDGVVLGRAMSVPSLEQTREHLSPTSSRQHVKLLPLEDGRIQIIDSSTHGTKIHEEHWQKRPQPPHTTT